MSKIYEVNLTSVFVVKVEADNEEEAKDLAMEKLDFDKHYHLDSTECGDIKETTEAPYNGELEEGGEDYQSLVIGRANGNETEVSIEAVDDFDHNGAEERKKVLVHIRQHGSTRVVMQVKEGIDEQVIISNC